MQHDRQRHLETSALSLFFCLFLLAAVDAACQLGEEAPLLEVQQQNVTSPAEVKVVNLSLAQEEGQDQVLVLCWYSSSNVNHTIILNEEESSFVLFAADMDPSCSLEFSCVVSLSLSSFLFCFFFLLTTVTKLQVSRREQQQLHLRNLFCLGFESFLSSPLSVNKRDKEGLILETQHNSFSPSGRLAREARDHHPKQPFRSQIFDCDHRVSFRSRVWRFDPSFLCLDRKVWRQ